MPEPVFSAADVGRLFGLADGTQSAMLKRWREAGQLPWVGTQDGAKTSHAVRVAPAAVLAFVRQHPDAYDWRKITDPLLKAEAERVEKHDPLVPLDQAIAGKELTKADVLLLAKKGTPGVVTRFSGRGRDVTREYFIRRSALSKLAAQLEKERLRADPYAVLHALIQAPEDVAAEVPRKSVNGHAATVAGPMPTAPAQPSVSDEARRCPQCGSRRIVSQALDGFELACMACGQSDPIVDPAAVAAREAKHQAEVEAIRAGASETRRLQGQGGRGRPNAVAS